MARSFSLATLRTRARDRADQEGSGNDAFVTDDELDRYISASYTRLYNLLQKAGLLYYEKRQTLTGDGTTERHTLNGDFFGILGVDVQVGNYWHALREFQFEERNHFQYTGSGIPVAFRLVGKDSAADYELLEVLPAASSGRSIRVTYIPAPADLSSDSDTVDGVSGWEEVIVLDAAIKCLHKEADTSTANALVAERDALMREIEEAAELREAGVPRRVRDVEAEDFADPFLMPA